jgi:hypothetical protein
MSLMGTMKGQPSVVCESIYLQVYFASTLKFLLSVQHRPLSDGLSL